VDQGARGRSNGPACRAISSPPTWFAFSFHALAYNLGNFLRSLATPEPIKDWSMTTLREIGAKVVGHARYVSFQMAEVAIPRNVFADILRMIAELRPPPIRATA
jgi:hypothetical protein